MKIRYTKHAELYKFAVLKRHAFLLSKRMIRQVVVNPDHVENKKDGTHIASKQISSSRVLRVVYRLDGDIILVITFYPAEKGRYYS